MFRKHFRVAIVLTVAMGLTGLLTGPIQAQEDKEYRLPGLKARVVPEIAWAIAPGAFDSIKGNLPVFEIKKDLRSPLNVASIAEAMDLGTPTDLDIDLSSGFWQLTAEQGTVQAFKWHGRVTAGDLDRMFDSSWSDYDLPTENEAHVIAVAYLKEIGLAPPDLDDTQVTFYHDYTGRKDIATGISSTSETGIQVRFQRTLEGLPAIGPGAKLYVHVHDEGLPVGVTKSWSPLMRSDELPIVSLATARERLSLGWGEFDVHPECETAALDQVQMKYFVPHLGGPSDWAFPIFVFSGTCDMADGPAPIEIRVSAV